MAVSDTIKAVPDQFFDALQVTQQLVLTNTSAIVASTRSLTSSLPKLPLSDRVPDLVALTGSTFDFASKLLASQRDFSIKLMQAYSPTEAPAVSEPSRRTARPA